MRRLTGLTLLACTMSAACMAHDPGWQGPPPNGAPPPAPPPAAAEPAEPPAAEPAAYTEPPPPVVYDEPAPPPAAPTRHPRCLPADSDELCDVLAVMVDVGELLTADADARCSVAAAHLEAWSSSNARRIDAMQALDRLPRAQLDGFQARHGDDVLKAVSAAMDLDQRCPGDRTVDHALGRAGFSGLVGAPGM